MEKLANICDIITGNREHSDCVRNILKVKELLNMKIAEVRKTVSNTSKHQSSTILVHKEINRLQENQEGDGGQEKILERKVGKAHQEE